MLKSNDYILNVLAEFHPFLRKYCSLNTSEIGNWPFSLCSVFKYKINITISDFKFECYLELFLAIKCEIECLCNICPSVHVNY